MANQDPLEAFSEEEVELTDEEIVSALEAAKMQKRANKKIEQYRNKLNESRSPVKMNYDQLRNYIVLKAKEEIVGFRVSQQDSIVWKKLVSYFSQDAEFESMGEGYSLNKGLLIAGAIGCGKTTLAQLFRRNPHMCYKVIPCRDIAREVVKNGVEAIEKYCGYIDIPLNEFNQRQLTYCFDDMGAERTAKNYGNEVNTMQQVLLSRYDFEKRTGFKTHITTNLTSAELLKDYEARVSSRCAEMFNIIDFPLTAKDKRKGN